MWRKRWRKLSSTSWKTGPSAGAPPCQGVIALGSSLRDCESELQSALEDWILLGLRLGHHLPVLGGIDLNKEPARPPVDAV